MLGVTGRRWVECDKLVHTFLLGDWMTNLMPQIGEMLDNTDIEILVYSGDKDWICNWRGGEAWTHATKWSGHDQFNANDYVEWNVEGKSAGQLKKYKNLNFLRVYDAGHMVPMNQPKVAQIMLQTFLNDDFKKLEVQEPNPWMLQ